MERQNLYDALTSKRSAFIKTMCYRDANDIEEDVLNHDGHVVLAQPQRGHERHSLWRALHECVTNPDTEAVLASPNPAGARGAILLIEDEIERSQFSEDVWGVQRSTDTGIDFDNGSRIVSRCAGDEYKDSDRLRGYKPDLLVVDVWDEEGYSISEDTKEQVLLPMLASKEANLWVNDVAVNQSDLLTEFALEQGAYVKQMDR